MFYIVKAKHLGWKESVVKVQGGLWAGEVREAVVQETEL